MKVPFVKYSGAGNDFVLIDICYLSLSYDLGALARSLCDRRRGIGADGLLLLLESKTADFQMRIFNADGSEPAMCGNGIRCLVDYVQREKNAADEITIETMHRILRCRKLGDQIAVDLGAPSVLHWPSGSVYVVDTGVPHAVLFVEDLENVDVAVEGKKVRFDPTFGPSGVNVNFAAIDADGRICVRTYERGVESETLACGTGAAAVAYVAATLHNLPSPIPIATRSSFSEGRPEFNATISFSIERSIEMLGHAEKVFEGSIDLEEFEKSP